MEKGRELVLQYVAVNSIEKLHEVHRSAWGMT